MHLRWSKHNGSATGHHDLQFCRNEFDLTTAYVRVAYLVMFLDASQYGLYAHYQFLVVIGFANIIVCANMKPMQFVFDCILCRDENNRDLVSLGSQPIGKFKAVDVGHGHVEKEQIG